MTATNHKHLLKDPCRKLTSWLWRLVGKGIFYTYES
jgi:hypothetical protein